MPLPNFRAAIGLSKEISLSIVLILNNSGCNSWDMKN